MDYLSCADTAEKLGITIRRVQQMCKQGELPGAVKDGRTWMIPVNVVFEDLNAKKKPLPIGVSDFKAATAGYYYVDKTLLIRDFLDTKPMVSLFTRPRRFGKTLNMDMLRVFFEKTAEDTSVYFMDKQIWQCGDFYTRHQGRYPVIFLTFKDVKCLSWEETFQKIRILISLEFMRHSELENSSVLTTYEKEQYHRLASDSATEVDCQMGLQLLSMLLHKHHGKECIIIIDEYDTPIQQGHNCNFYSEIVNFMRNFFSGGLKDNPHLAFGFLTGILRVAKESIFSGMNNLKINSILDESYSEYFGFTKEEVKDILSYYEKEEKYQEICDWYDGYKFGNTEIFNPWSVIGYFGNECTPRAFWQSTGSNDIISEVLKLATPETMERLKALMQGEAFVTHIDTGVIYPQIQKNPSSIYSFLLVTGYLKSVKAAQPFGSDYMCEVALPNKEISYVYSKEILSQLENLIPPSAAIAIQEAIYTMDISALQKRLEEFLIQTISYHDAANETFYHGLILGLCAMLDNCYRITSNREAGDGRFDIQMKPLDGKLPGIIIELKAAKDYSQEQLNVLAQKALEQIDER